MTTLYFEAPDGDGLRKTGFSKDGRYRCSQIFSGLLTTGGGNPPGYEIFEGNILKGIPSFILGARVKNSTTVLKEQVLSFNLNNGGVKAIRQDNGTRLTVSMSDKRARKDKHNRGKGLARLQKRIRSGKPIKSGINNRGYNKYLKLGDGVTVTPDKEKFAAGAAWDGIKGYVTNTKLCGKSTPERNADIVFETKPGRKETEWLILATNRQDGNKNRTSKNSNNCIEYVSEGMSNCLSDANDAGRHPIRTKFKTCGLMPGAVSRRLHTVPGGGRILTVQIPFLSFCLFHSSNAVWSISYTLSSYHLPPSV
ncbi:MAG: hypothetical protein LBK22_03935, partial [Tannerella sp.]|nr:hypothetical protein [Tannerella sp.]